MIAELVPLALAHLRLVLIAVAVAAVAALGMGVLALRSRLFERIALGASSLVQTIPGIALLAAMVPLLAALGRATGIPISGIGELPALLALTLYALLPIVRGVVTGVRAIDPAIHQASLAVGMTRRQRLRFVELPLATPAAVAGFRTAVVWTVGMATLATPVGATSLGNLIFGGLQTRRYDQIALGCVAAATIAIVLDALLGWIERRSRQPRGHRLALAALAVLASLALVLIATTKSAGGVHAEGRVRIGAKSFAEQHILVEILRCALGSDVEVDVHPSLGSTVAFDALQTGGIDLYVEYTGTAWTTLLHKEGPRDRKASLKVLAGELADKHHVHVASRLGFENAYAMVVRGDDSARSLTDLADRDFGGSGNAHARSFGGDYEFFSRPEWSALKTAYGLAPKVTRTMDPALLYQALASSAVDVVAGYTTDAAIARLGLRVLDDPKHAIPPYDAIVLAADAFASKRPDLINRLGRLDGTIDEATMRSWNELVTSGMSARKVAMRHPACRARAGQPR